MKKLFKTILAIIGSIATFEVLRRNGVIDQLTGKVKQAVGEATGNKQMQAEGKFDEAKGKTRKFVSDVKESAKETVEAFKEE